jgi:peptidoglycan/xylan/chitin deacetylase (PgdA/CDA1 family)
VGGVNDWQGQAGWAPRFAMVSWDQVDALVAAGWDIQSHTVRHVDLRSLDDGELEEELAAANDAIERRVGKRPDSLAFPHGHFTDRVLKLARRQNSHCFTTELAPLDRGANETERGYPRLDAYYLQSEPVRRRFGSTPFLVYIGLRAFARRMRAG